MIVVSDTSAITNLLQIGEIEILRLTFSNVIIPNAVFEEICRIDSNRIALAGNDWIERAGLANTELRDRLLNRIDLGEAEAISLAIELKADYLLIDELLGRSIASELGLKITGILGVLSLAKRDGHIDLIRPYVERLISEAGFRLSATLVEEVLRQADEN